MNLILCAEVRWRAAAAAAPAIARESPLIEDRTC